MSANAERLKRYEEHTPEQYLRGALNMREAGWGVGDSAAWMGIERLKVIKMLAEHDAGKGK
jgi:hypothetical protein